MKTRLHTYYFDTTDKEQAAKYRELKRRLKYDEGLECFKSLGDHHATGTILEGHDIELETECLFADQWNTAPIADSVNGYHVFDWAENAIWNYGQENTTIKYGYWLEQTPEMKAIRQSISKCGYCGKQQPTGAFTFCPLCIDSEYLKPTELRLTRMMPISFDGQRPELSESERTYLMSLYREAQLHGTSERGAKRIAKARADVHAKYEAAITAATEERDGFIWLMDKGIRTDNVIYYSHTKQFHFGWRSPLSDDVVSELLNIISEFRWPYQLTCADGRKLTAV